MKETKCRREAHHGSKSRGLLSNKALPSADFRVNRQKGQKTDRELKVDQQVEDFGESVLGWIFDRQ